MRPDRGVLIRRAAAAPQLRTDGGRLAGEGGPAGPAPTITGYAARFDDVFRPRGASWIERVAPTAFDRALRERADVRALWSHDPAIVLGRTTSGTLRLWRDAVGLAFSLRVNLEDPDGKAAYEKVRRRDVAGCSWGAFVLKERVTRPRGAGPTEVLIEDLDLFDVTLTAFPAYERTTAEVRQAGGAHAARLRLIALTSPHSRTTP